MRDLQHSHARLAQSVERWTLNPTVVGSSPTLGEYLLSFSWFIEFPNSKLTHQLTNRNELEDYE